MYFSLKIRGQADFYDCCAAEREQAPSPRFGGFPRLLLGLINFSPPAPSAAQSARHFQRASCSLHDGENSRQFKPLIPKGFIKRLGWHGGCTCPCYVASALEAGPHP
jgi:hypothetical protein